MQKMAAIGAILPAILATVGAPVGAEDYLCVYAPNPEAAILKGDGEPLERCVTTEDSYSRSGSMLISTGRSSTKAEVDWSVTLIPLAPTDSAPDLVTTRDYGTYSNDWTLVYQGDMECRRINLGTWEAYGLMYLGYLAYEWLGDHSSSSGTKTGTVWQHIEASFAVEAEGNTAGGCDAARNLRMEAVRTVAEGYASLNLGKFRAVDATATWTIGAISTCEIRNILTGISSNGGTVLHTSSGGNIAATTFNFLSEDFAGRGDTKICVFSAD